MRTAGEKLRLRFDAAQGLGGREDGDVLVDFESEQMLIAGDDQIGLSGDRAGEHMIVVGIARDGLRELASGNELRQASVVEHYLCWREGGGRDFFWRASCAVEHPPTHRAGRDW